MDVIANDLIQFSQDIEEYKGALQSFAENYGRLCSHMGELSEMWEGEAYQELMNSFETDKSRIQELENLLAQILGDMKYAQEEYINCENDVMGLVDSISI